MDASLKRKLMLWKFESDLKIIYEKFIAAIEVCVFISSNVTVIGD